MKQTLRTAYEDHTAKSDASGIDCSKNDPKQKVQAAQQQFKDECDINVLIKKFGIDNLPITKRMPIIGDFADVMDYQTALNMVLEADEAFMQLPGKVRERFDDSPQKLMEFLENRDNRDEAVKLGLIDPPTPPAPPPEPMAVRIVADAPKA